MTDMTRGELNLSALRPKPNLKLRLMFDGGWKWLTIIGVIFVLVAVVSLLVVLHAISVERRFEKEAVVTTATITEKNTYTTTEEDTETRHRHTERHYRVFYTFAAPDGRNVQGKAELRKQRWESLDPGDTIQVEYLASDPGQNRPVEARSGKLVTLLILLPVVFLAVSLILLAIVGRRASKHGRLLSQGTLTQGRVEEKIERQDITINNRHPYTVRYVFDVPEGKSHAGKDLITDLDFAARLLPGKPVGVIYLLGDPGKNTIFRDKWAKYFVEAGS
jgi:flagellar basal body-associated protein FliL